MRKLKTFFNTSNRYYVFCYSCYGSILQFFAYDGKCKNTSYVRKNGDSAYAGVNVTSLSYPSATIKFKAYKQGKGFVSNYNSVRGIGGTQVIYTSTVYKDDRIKLYGYNPSSNGGVTVTVSGYWNP